MKLSEKLIELRKANGWSQEDLAEKVDVSRQAISRWENGTALPDAQNLLRISKLFLVTADYLLNDDVEERTEPPAAEEKPEAKAAADAPPPPPKRRRLLWLLLPMSCFLLLAVYFMVRTVQLSGAHHHSAFSCVRENEIAPTCTAEGSFDEVIFCTECDEELLRTHQSVAKLPHVLSESVRENEVAPTCTAEGSFDEVVFCAECGEELLRTHRSVAKLSHQYQNRFCTLCGEAEPSQGLSYLSNGNGTCIVSRGDCLDEHVVIPAYSPDGDRVTHIKTGAFLGDTLLKSVKLPETVTYIGESAFRDCTNLESINLPSGITMIRSYTFASCTSLKEITIPENVYSIGTFAFSDCVSCQSIVIPAKVEKIGAFAFRNFSACEGTATFRNASGWKLYDENETLVDVVYFEQSFASPMLLLSFLRCEYSWRRG